MSVPDIAWRMQLSITEASINFAHVSTHSRCVALYGALSLPAVHKLFYNRTNLVAGRSIAYVRLLRG